MATIYLNADTGNDTTGNGTAGNPYLTISKAHTVGSSGDTVVLQEATASYAFANITFTKTLTIRAENYGDAVISSSGAERVWKYSGNINFTAENLIFDDITASPDGAFPGPLFDNCDNQPDTQVHIFRNCRFSSIILRGESSIASYYGMFGTSTPPTTGSFTLTLERCLIDDVLLAAATPSGKIYIFGDRGRANSKITLINTTIVQLTASQLTQIFRWDNSGSGEIELRNSIIANLSGSTVNWGGTFATTDVMYSDLYSITSSPSGTGVLTSDPLFVDASSGNFNLRPTSPAINSGTLV